MLSQLCVTLLQQIMNWNSTFSIVIPLPVVLWPPTQDIYSWYIQLPTHGMLTPLSMVFWNPIHDNLNPLSMIFWTLYSWYFDPPQAIAYRSPIHRLLNPLPMVFWPSTHGSFTSLSMVFHWTISGHLT